jgi:hypothetical protein
MRAKLLSGRSAEKTFADGRAVIDLRLVRHDGDVGIHVLRRDGHIDIVMEK